MRYNIGWVFVAGAVIAAVNVVIAKEEHGRIGWIAASCYAGFIAYSYLRYGDL